LAQAQVLQKGKGQPAQQPMMVQPPPGAALEVT
jgi:hypothetical protein